MQVNCLTFDCLNGLCPSPFKTFFRLKSSSSSSTTRSHVTKPFDIELNIECSKIGPALKKSYPVKAVQLWNALPSSIQCLKSKKEFKNILKRSILNGYKSSIICKNPLCVDVVNCRHV